MDTLIDDLGEWQQLGSISFTGEDSNWIYLARTLAKDTFRMTWSTDWDKWKAGDGYRSWAYIQFRYPSTGDTSPNSRIFPRQGKTIIPLPSPDQVYTMRPEREIWVRQWINYRMKPWLNLESDAKPLPLTLSLEGLLPLP